MERMGEGEVKGLLEKQDAKKRGKGQGTRCRSARNGGVSVEVFGTYIAG